MKILVIDDREFDRNIATRVAESYGDVREADSVEAAAAALGSGWRPDIVLTDLHMGGRDPLETFGDILALVDLQRTAVIALTSDAGDVRLSMRFRDKFPSSRLVEKSALAIRDVLAAIRINEGGRAVATMDQGTVASHDQIEAVIHAWWTAKLKGLKIDDYWIRQQVERRLDCLSARQRILWAAGLAVLALLVTTVTGFVARAVYQSALTGGPM